MSMICFSFLSTDLVQILFTRSDSDYIYTVRVDCQVQHIKSGHPLDIINMMLVYFLNSEERPYTSCLHIKVQDQ